MCFSNMFEFSQFLLKEPMLIQDAEDKNTKHESHNFSRRQCNLCWKILHDSYYETNGMSLCKDCYCRYEQKLSSFNIASIHTNAK